LVAVVRKYTREPLLGPGVQDVARGDTRSSVPRPPSPHAHVERRTRTERESPLGAVDLVRADAEIEQDAVRRKRLDGLQDGRLGEGPLEVLDSLRAQAFTRRSQGVGISIYSQ